MVASSLTDTQGILALAALAVALLALIACLLLMRSLRGLRRTQKMVLGDGSQRDVIAHGASLQQAFEALQEYVGDVASRLDTRLDGTETALTGAISHRALVRYDAYNELSGQQSVSIALLDDRQSGVVLSCIHHRDQARVYAKQIFDGSSELELSPEEAQAMAVALGRNPASPDPAIARGSEGEDTRAR
ncbi:MAG TPA: DUF4446 family protein [Solirubrobacteraceae bacterium]|jgi:hypothetical protein